jgi:hypothetical protein
MQAFGRPYEAPRQPVEEFTDFEELESEPKRNDVADIKLPPTPPKEPETASQPPKEEHGRPHAAQPPKPENPYDQMFEQ